MKRIGLIFMLTQIIFTLSAVTAPRITEQGKSARGQPLIFETSIVNIELPAGDVATSITTSEVFNAEKPGIVAINSEKRNEMVICKGIRRERDVDSCNVIPNYLYNETIETIARHVLPNKFGLLQLFYC